ncbi:MAG: L,D-transpeptidase family protein [Alphaproteobacteria bacterium]|nr:L,D-transpeptidase family protein [Alphaproteobacteria bacterium]
MDIIIETAPSKQKQNDTLSATPQAHPPTLGVFHFRHTPWPHTPWPCALGRGGIRADKREGDEASPAGTWPLRQVWYRPDRWQKPDTKLPIRAIAKTDGWSDDPKDTAYNRVIRRPHAFHCETLWRDDRLYDVFIELGYNDDPPIAGKGSAIFLHLATEDYAPTQGCAALAPEHMRLLLPHLTQAMTLTFR